MTNDKRLPKGANRDEGGRFLKGCAPGPGNPYSAKVAELRTALLAAITEKDIQDVIKALLKEAKKGNVPAARIILDRALGPIEASDVLERIEELERLTEVVRS